MEVHPSGKQFCRGYFTIGRRFPRSHLSVLGRGEMDCCSNFLPFDLLTLSGNRERQAEFCSARWRISFRPLATVDPWPEPRTSLYDMALGEEKLVADCKRSLDETISRLVSMRSRTKFYPSKHMRASSSRSALIQIVALWMGLKSMPADYDFVTPSLFLLTNLRAYIVRSRDLLVLRPHGLFRCISPCGLP